MHDTIAQNSNYKILKMLNYKIVSVPKMFVCNP
jgi:hypothetical protein